MTGLDLRQVLDAAGYSESTVGEVLQVSDPVDIARADFPLYIRRLPSDQPLSDLLRLFLFELAVPEEAASRALAPLPLSELAEEGLLEWEGASVRGRVRLTPSDGFVLAHDRLATGDLSRNHVLGPNPSARTLAALTVRRPVEAALDVGTGCGVQALLAARHGTRVVAVDINPRALWFSELNARLNGVANVEWRAGDLFEPVEGEEFDLVVANPPFVISPSLEYEFRDSAEQGDALSQGVVAEAAASLREGGFAHVLCNCVHRGDEDWSAPVAGWVQDSGCDALLVRHHTADPLTYAARWNQHLAGQPERLAEVIDRWLAHYRELGVEAITLAAVILRRRRGPTHWTRTAELAGGPAGDAGSQVERIFSAADTLGPVEDGDLLDRAFAHVDGHQLHQVLSYRDGTYTANPAAIVLDEGLGLHNQIDPLALHVLFRLDGARPLGALVAEAAEEIDQDPEALATAVARAVRHLAELGLLEQVGAPAR